MEQQVFEYAPLEGKKAVKDLLAQYGASDEVNESNNILCALESYTSKIYIEKCFQNCPVILSYTPIGFSLFIHIQQSAVTMLECLEFSVPC